MSRASEIPAAQTYFRCQRGVRRHGPLRVGFGFRHETRDSLDGFRVARRIGFNQAASLEENPFMFLEVARRLRGKRVCHAEDHWRLAKVHPLLRVVGLRRFAEPVLYESRDIVIHTEMICEYRAQLLVRELLEQGALYRRR